MRIPIEIETQNRHLAFELDGTYGSLNNGISLPGRAKLEYEGTLVRKAVGIPDILKFILDTAINVEISLVAAWLYDAVKGRQVERIVINRRVVTEITADGIRQVLEEEIRRGG